MGNKLFMELTALLCMIFVFVGVVYATGDDSDDDDFFKSFFTVDSEGSTEKKTFFDFNETPWLYFLLEGEKNEIRTVWTSPSGLQFTADFDSKDNDDNHKRYNMSKKYNKNKEYNKNRKYNKLKKYNRNKKYNEDNKDRGDYGFEGWISLNNWDTVKELGGWMIVGCEDDDNGDCSGDHEDDIVATTSFTVVPEPISSTLFLVGGAILGFRHFHMKRKI